MIGCCVPLRTPYLIVFRGEICISRITINLLAKRENTLNYPNILLLFKIKNNFENPKVLGRQTCLWKTDFCSTDIRSNCVNSFFECKVN